jgi:hypothetical protein
MSDKIWQPNILSIGGYTYLRPKPNDPYIDNIQNLIKKNIQIVSELQVKCNKLYQELNKHNEKTYNYQKEIENRNKNIDIIISNLRSSLYCITQYNKNDPFIRILENKINDFRKELRNLKSIYEVDNNKNKIQNQDNQNQYDQNQYDQNLKLLNEHKLDVEKYQGELDVFHKLPRDTDDIHSDVKYWEALMNSNPPPRIDLFQIENKINDHKKEITKLKPVQNVGGVSDIITMLENEIKIEESRYEEIKSKIGINCIAEEKRLPINRISYAIYKYLLWCLSRGLITTDVYGHEEDVDYGASGMGYKINKRIIKLGKHIYYKGFINVPELSIPFLLPGFYYDIDALDSNAEINLRNIVQNCCFFPDRIGFLKEPDPELMEWMKLYGFRFEFIPENDKSTARLKAQYIDDSITQYVNDSKLLFASDKPQEKVFVNDKFCGMSYSIPYKEDENRKYYKILYNRLI